MNAARYTFNPIKLINLLVSFFVFLLCFYYARPLEPTHDALSRFSMASNFSPDFWYLLLLNEPFSLVMVRISRSPYEFLLLYAFLAAILSCRLLRIPLWVWGFFMLSPLGYLLTFNVTPSLIAFSVVNFTLLTRIRGSLLVFGLTNHLVALLSLCRVGAELFLASFRTKLFAVILLAGIFLVLRSFLQNKLLGYSGVSGNIYHSYFALCCLVIIFISGTKNYRFVALMYMVLILGAMVVSIKMSSRLAFGADLLTLQFCITVVKLTLVKSYPLQVFRY